MWDHPSCARVRRDALECRIGVAFGPLPRAARQRRAVLCCAVSFAEPAQNNDPRLNY